MSTIIQGPPLYIETKSAFVEDEKKVGEEGNSFGETMTSDEKGTSHIGTEHMKIMEPIFEEMNKNIMKGFELLAIPKLGKIY